MRRKNHTKRPKKPQHKALLVRFPTAAQHRELKDYADETGESMNNVVLLAVERHIRRGDRHLAAVPDLDGAA
jgi:hypothetical protein